MGRTAVRCSCGQRIGEREVMHAGFFARPFGPSFVRVRYRCPRCRRRGEDFLRQEEWNAGILRDARVETVQHERDQFDALGAISLREQADFHAALDSLDDLAALNDEFRGLRSEDE